VTGDTDGVDYIEADAGGIPAMGALPKGCALESPHPNPVNDKTAAYRWDLASLGRYFPSQRKI